MTVAWQSHLLRAVSSTDCVLCGVSQLTQCAPFNIPAHCGRVAVAVAKIGGYLARASMFCDRRVWKRALIVWRCHHGWGIWGLVDTHKNTITNSDHTPSTIGAPYADAWPQPDQRGRCRGLMSSHSSPRIRRVRVCSRRWRASRGYPGHQGSTASRHPRRAHVCGL